MITVIAAEKKMPTMTPASSSVWIDSSRPIAAIR
jgi:hypothetical protein